MPLKLWVCAVALMVAYASFGGVEKLVPDMAAPDARSGVVIPAGPEAKTQADFDRFRSGWAKRNVSDVYLKFAGAGGLNQRAAQFYLDSMKVCMAVETGAEFKAAAAKEGRELKAAGHSEPLTGCFLGLVLADSERKEAGALFLAANAAVSKNPKYPPLLRFLVGAAAKAKAEDAFLQAYADGVFAGEAARCGYALIAAGIVSGSLSDAFLDKLKAAGGDPWLYLASFGGQEICRAWRDRGSGWGSSVTAAGWAGFARHLELARQALSEAWRLHPDRPEPAADMVTVCMGGGGQGDDATLWFNRAVKAQMDFSVAYDCYLWQLWPRWSGSHARMVKFGEACLATGRFDTVVPYYYFLALLSVAGDSPYCRWKAPFRAPGAIEKLELLLGRSAQEAKWASPERFQYELALCELWAGRHQKAAELFAKVPASFDASGCATGVSRLDWVPKSRTGRMAELKAFTGPFKERFLEVDRLALAGESEWAAAALERLLPSLQEDKELEGYARDELVYLLMGMNAEDSREDGIPAVNVAAREGKLTALESALRFNSGAGLGAPLDHAVRRGDTAAVRLLLRHGASPDFVKGSSMAPLTCALANKRPEIVQLLLDAGADTLRLDDFRNSLLHMAAWYGDTARVERCLSQGFDINAVNAQGRGALTQAVLNGRLETAAFLLAKGADSNCMDKTPCSPLYWAAWRGDAKMVEELLRHKASPNTRCYSSMTPLGGAAGMDNPAIVEMLLAAGADSEARDCGGFTPLARAAFYGKFDNVELLLRHGADLNAPEGEGSTPLLELVMQGDVKKVQALLRFKPDLEARDLKGRTPLGVAAGGKDPALAALLLAAGADINAKDGAGRTLLMAAASAGDAKQVERLLRLGADPGVKDKSGHDAAAWAELSAQAGADTPKFQDTLRLLRRPVGRAPN